MVVVGAIERPRPFGMDLRVLGVNAIFVAFVVDVCHFGRPTSAGVVFPVLVGGSISSFGDDLDGVVGWLFLFGQRILGSQGPMARCLWVNGLFRYVVGFVYLDDYFFDPTAPYRWGDDDDG